MSLDQPRLYIPDDLVVARFGLSGVAGQLQFAYVYPTPDARILLKLALVFYQETTVGSGSLDIPFDPTLNNSIAWGLSVQAGEKNPLGAWTPTVNIVGAGRTPAGGFQQVVPLTAGLAVAAQNLLSGFSVDVQGGQDCVMGTVGAVVAAPWGPLFRGVTAVLHARYQATVEMCDAEWAWARSQMSPTSNQQAAGF